MKKGGVGIIEMNKYLQKELNPKKREEDEIVMGDNIFRLGDKVIQTRNNYDLNIFNGDVGRIVHVDTNDPKNRSIKVNFDDEVVVDLTTKDMLDLELAYCLTIHKSQGSEYDYVILPLMMQYGRMLYKQLIYTALTRAKKRAIFVGQFKALETAIKNSDSQLRQSTLDDLLRSDEEEPIELDADLKGWGWNAE
jgi:exodeoxyribonuclease V alpha subunit